MYPAAFLSGVGKSAPLAFKGNNDDSIESTWDEMKDHFVSLRYYAQDFFPLNDKKKPEIPDVVYEVFGALCHDFGRTVLPENISDDARQILSEINFLRMDAYPRQTDYASQEARFIFLLISYIQSFSYANHYAESAAPRKYEALFQENFLNPMRTLDPEASRLENNIIRNIQRIEFMLAFENHPYYAEHLKFIRETAENSLNSHTMLRHLGLPPTDHMTKALIIGNTHLAEYNMIAADRTLALLLSPYAPTKLLRACIPDIEEEFLVFSMLMPFIKSGEWNHWKDEWFGDSALKFEAWHDWATSGIEPASPLPEDVSDKLAAINAASDIMDLERLSLLLLQDESPTKPILYEQSLIDAKVSLMNIRETALMRPTSYEDLARLRMDLLSSAFRSLHNLSERYPMLLKKIEIVDNRPSPQDPAL